MLTTRTPRITIPAVLTALACCSTSIFAQATATPPATAPATTAPAALEAMCDEKSKALIKREVEVTMGDHATARDLKSMHVEATMSMPAQGMEIDMNIVVAADDKMAVTMTIPGLGKMQTGLSDGMGWSFSELQGPAIMSDEEYAQAARQADFYSTLEWEKYYTKATYAGEETIQDIDDKDVETDVVVFVDRTSGRESRAYFDKATGLRIRVDETQIAPGQGEIPTTTRMGDFRKVNGMMSAHKVRLSAGPIEQIITTNKLEFNAPVAADTFNVPDEIKAIRKN